MLTIEQAVAASDVGLVVLDRDDVIALASRGAEILCTAPRGGLIGRTLTTLVEPDDQQTLEACGAEPIDVRLRGQPERWVSLTAKHADGFSVVTMCDVSERKRFERTLSDTADRFGAFLDASSALAWMKGADGRYVYANAAWAKAHGVASAIAVESEAALDAVDEQVLRDGHARVTEDETVDEAGVRRRWQSARFLFWDSAGSRFLGGIAVDVTPQRAAEVALEQAQEQLRQAQKMEAVGRLAGGVAHDFNNLLTIILSYASIAEGSCKSDDARAALAEIAAAGNRAAQLTRQLLSVSRRRVLEVRAVLLDDIIRGMTSLLAPVLGDDVQMTLALDAPKAIWADVSSVEQVVLNFAVNAADAMPLGGRLTIATADVTLDDAGARAVGAPCAGSYARLSVIDTGTGMDEATKAHIFEPFFTTKEQGKGTGLGLSIVRGIVQQLRGAVSVESTMGRGTRFDVYLPHAQVSATAPRAPEHAPESTSGHEAILLVEDDARIRSLATAVLVSSGYRVVAAAHPAAALAIARDEGAIDLLVTDVIMPGMTGLDLADRLRARHPRMRVLFVSGYTGDRVDPDALRAQGRAFLAKPFTPRDLSHRVRAVLDA